MIILTSLTMQRLRSGGHWICKLRRFTTLFEMAALQGLPRTILDQMRNTSQSDADIGAAIGDAMSINVLMRIFPVILHSSGLPVVSRNRYDIWKDAASVAGMMPDSLYIKKGCLNNL